MGVIFNSIIALLVSALVLWIVSKLNLGLSVKGFGSAIIAAVVIAVITAVVFWLLGILHITIAGGLIGWLLLLIIAAVVLMLSGRVLPGLKVEGFGGAIIAALAIAVVSWIVSALLGIFGIAV